MNFSWEDDVQLCVWTSAVGCCSCHIDERKCKVKVSFVETGSGEWSIKRAEQQIQAGSACSHDDACRLWCWTAH